VWEPSGRRQPHSAALRGSAFGLDCAQTGKDGKRTAWTWRTGRPTRPASRLPYGQAVAVRSCFARSVRPPSVRCGGRVGGRGGRRIDQPRHSPTIVDPVCSTPLLEPPQGTRPTIGQVPLPPGDDLTPRGRARNRQRKHHPSIRTTSPSTRLATVHHELSRFTILLPPDVMPLTINKHDPLSTDALTLTAHDALPPTPPALSFEPPPQTTSQPNDPPGAYESSPAAFATVARTHTHDSWLHQPQQRLPDEDQKLINQLRIRRRRPGQCARRTPRSKAIPIRQHHPTRPVPQDVPAPRTRLLTIPDDPLATHHITDPKINPPRAINTETNDGSSSDSSSGTCSTPSDFTSHLAPAARRSQFSHISSTAPGRSRLPAAPP